MDYSIYCSHLDCYCDEGRKYGKKKVEQEKETVGSRDTLKPLSPSTLKYLRLPYSVQMFLYFPMKVLV